jgi:hypothetical protein
MDGPKRRRAIIFGKGTDMNKIAGLLIVAGVTAAGLSAAHARPRALEPVVAMNEGAPSSAHPASRTPEPRLSTDDYVNAHLMILGQYRSAGMVTRTAPAAPRDANS